MHNNVMKNLIREEQEKEFKKFRKNEINNFIIAEQHRICNELENKLLKIKLDENKEELLRNLEMTINVSDIKINLKFIQMQQVKKDIMKLHKKIYGFTPTDISYKLCLKNNDLETITFDYSKSFLNIVLLYDLFIFIPGFIFGALFVSVLSIL